MRDDSPLASASWRWYCSRIPEASSLARSASSRLLRILSARASIPFLMAGKPTLAMRTNRMEKESAAQMISLVAGRMGFLAFVPSSAAWARMASSTMPP